VGLAEEKYMLFTTFRRDGRAVATPVWVVGLPGGELGFSTGSGSGKAKRLRHTPRVTVQACDRSGSTTHGETHTATARLVSGEELARIRTAVRAKYGAMALLTSLFPLVARLRGKPSEHEIVGVVVSLIAR
jgi:PPOX class probable F420-dependent enzyme